MDAGLMTQQAERCAGKVWDKWGDHSCSRRGSIERNGKLWCRVHDPEAEAERKVKRDVEYQRKKNIDLARWAVAEVEREIVAAVRAGNRPDREKLRRADEALVKVLSEKGGGDGKRAAE